MVRFIQLIYVEDYNQQEDRIYKEIEEINQAYDRIKKTAFYSRQLGNESESENQTIFNANQEDTEEKFNVDPQK